MKILRSLLPDYLQLRLSVEQLSLLEIAARREITELKKIRDEAQDTNNDTVNILAVNRRIRQLTKARELILESLDS